MYAFPVVQRTALAVLCFTFILAVPLAFAGEDNSGYLGVMLQDVSPSMAKALQLGEKSGVMINDVVDDSPAAGVGLESGDIILEFQGKEINDYKALTAAVRKTKPGESVEILVLHNGKEQTLKVEMGERENDFTWQFYSDDGEIHSGNDFHFDSDEATVWMDSGNGKVLMFKGEGDEDMRIEMLKDMHEDSDGEQQIIIKKMIEGDHENLVIINSDRGFMGVHLDDIEGQMAEYFGLEDGQGALITEVNEDSPAAEAGLKAGDVIIKLGDEDIESTQGLHQAMAETKPEQEIDIKVLRKGKNKTLTVTLGEAPENMMIKNIEIISDGDDTFTITAPKMWRGKHGSAHKVPHAQYKVMRKHQEDMGDHHRQLEWIHERDDLDELRQELKEMKKELKKMKKELKKK